MTRADRLIIAVLAAAAVVAWPLASAVGAGGTTAMVSGPDGRTVVPLSDDGEYVIAGAEGDLIVRVSDGTVSVVGSECPDQTCVHTGSVSAAGEVIACVPNRVVVRVGGERADGLDARVR